MIEEKVWNNFYKCSKGYNSDLWNKIFNKKVDSIWSVAKEKLKSYLMSPFIC
jgi:hypothetical protein